MAANPHFETLVMELNAEERRAMLQAIRAGIGAQPEPLFVAEEIAPPNLEQTFRALSWFERIWIQLLSILRGVDRDDLVTQRLIRALERDVQRKSGALLDAHRRLLLEPFAKRLEGLSRAARQLAQIIVPVTDGRRTEYVVYLGALLMPREHQLLLQNTDPASMKNAATTSERELKQRLAQAQEEAIQAISESTRLQMRAALHFVDQLAALAGINYGAMLMPFEADEKSKNRQCAFDYLAGHLERLARIIAALDHEPDLLAVQALVLLRTELDGPRELAPGQERTAADEVTSDLLALLGVFNGIRDFAQTVPLQLLLQLMKKDLWFRVRPNEGGEDWLNLYRRYFGARAEALATRFQLQQRLIQFNAGMIELVGKRLDEPPFPAYHITAPLMRRRYTAATLRSGAQYFWPEMLQLLKQILHYGEFYKAGNRAQFNDSFNDLQSVPQAMQGWARMFEPSGQGALVLNDRGALEAAALAEAQLEPILTVTRNATELMSNLLGGILYAHAGSTYDTLANFGEIGGRRNNEFIEELKQLHRSLDQFRSILSGVVDLERRAAELKIALDLR